MKKIDIKKIIEPKDTDISRDFPPFISNVANKIHKLPSFMSNLAIKYFEYISHIKEVNKILKMYENTKDFEFIDKLFTYLDFSYYISDEDKNKIPAKKKLICVSNHPLGALDALSLLSAIGKIRPDVRIVANDSLLNIENLANLFLPYNAISKKIQKNRITGIEEALINDEAVIFFPASRLSRFTKRGIRDTRWVKGPIRLACKFNAPILPILIKARNSNLFYISSLFFRNFTNFLIPREIFLKRSKSIKLKLGDPIPAKIFKSSNISFNIQTKLLKDHIYNIDQNKTFTLKTK